MLHLLPYAELAAHLLCALSSVVTLVQIVLGTPIPGFTLGLLSALLQSFKVMRLYGRPQLSTDYWRTAILNDETHFMFFGLIVSQFPALNIALLFPLASRSALFCAHALKQLSAVHTPNSTVMNGTIIPLLDKLITNSWGLYDLNSQLEVYAMVLGVLEMLFRRSGSVLALVLLFQYLKLRYAVSASSKRGFTAFRLSCDGIFLGAYSPQLVRNVYVKLRDWIASFGQLPAPPAPADQANGANPGAGGGLLSRCTIM